MNASTENIQDVLRTHGRARVRHHLGDTFIVAEAKPLGFGTNKPMVRFHNSNGWTVIDPHTWEVERIK